MTALEKESTLVGRKRYKNNPVPNLDGESRPGASQQNEAENSFAELRSSNAFSPDLAKDTILDEITNSNDSSTNAKKSSRGDAVIEIDLHGLTALEAIQRVDAVIAQQHSSKGKQETTFRIITGKGRRSGPKGGVLSSVVHEHMRCRYSAKIRYLQSSPAEVTLAGTPVRGYFTIILGS